MVKTKLVGVLCASLLAAVGVIASVNTSVKAEDQKVPYSKFNMIAPQPEPKIVEPDELSGVQVPIAKENRKFNVSGVQCVWCSLENLARHHKETKLYDLTEKFKHATGPNYVARVLASRDVKYKQVYSGKKAGIDFIKEYVTKKKLGVGIGINNVHMINVIHFDEAKGIVKVIDNDGPDALKVQTWTMEKFNQNFDGWAVVIFPPDYRETLLDKRWGRKELEAHPLDKTILSYYDEK
jgi:hypothetical protein